jgi:hypothetical protein
MSKKDNHRTRDPNKVGGPSKDLIIHRLPEPISANADYLITIVGKHFTDHKSWVSAVRLLLIVPPTVPQLRSRGEFSPGDCLAWLDKLATQIAELRIQKPYRMIAALEGSPDRGWFYSVILDLPKKVSLKRLRAVVQSSKPSRLCLSHIGKCDGVFESSHLIGRFGIAQLTEDMI